MVQQKKVDRVFFAVFCAVFFWGMLAHSPGALAQYSDEFYDCFYAICKPADKACATSKCSDGKIGCSRPCGPLYSNHGAVCPKVVCGEARRLPDTDPCKEVMVTTTMDCLAGCWGEDESGGYGCGGTCRQIARNTYTACNKRVKSGEKGEDVKKEMLMNVNPKEKEKRAARKAGFATVRVDGKPVMLKIGKISKDFGKFKGKGKISYFEIGRDAILRRFDAFGKYDMTASADNAIFYTGLGTAGAYAVGAMTFGSGLIIVGGVTFAASSLKNFIKESEQTLDVGAAAKKGALIGAYDAGSTLLIDAATGKVLGWIGKGGGRIAARFGRPIGSFIRSSSRMGAASAAIVDDVVRVGNRMAQSKIGQRIIGQRLDEKGLKYITSVDAFQEFTSSQITNAVSNPTQGYTSKKFEEWMYPKPKRTGKIFRMSKGAVSVRYVSPR